MNPEELRHTCLALSQATETFPFGEGMSVFKTSGNDKIFAISALMDDPLRVSLKCDPELSILLQSQYSQITPGYHLNKKHWITVVLDDGGVPTGLVEQLIHDSHALVRPKLRKEI